MKKIKYLLLSSALVLGVVPQAQATKLPASNSHCVAYKTEKTLALVKNVTVIGSNCNISVTAKKQGGKYFAEVLVPIKSFNSGDKDRDKWVVKELKASKQPNLIFRTMAYSSADWSKMLKAGKASVKGVLIIAGRKYPVTSTATVKTSGSNAIVSGKVVSKFTNYGIQPPTVGPGGSVAKAKNYLELHYNLMSSKVKNMGIVK